MAFSLLCISVLIMFFQPVSLFPELDPYQPLRNSAIIAMIAYIIAGEKSENNFFMINTNKFFLLFILMQILSSTAVWLRAGIETFNLWIRYGIIYFLIVRSGLSTGKIRALSLMIVISIGYLSYYSFVEYFKNYEPGLQAGGFGWYDNANDLAMILVCVMPLALLIAETSSSLLIKYLFMAISGVLSYNILLTGSRNGLLGLFTVGGLSLMLSKKIPGPVRISLFVLLSAAILTVGITSVLGRADLVGLAGDASSENRKIQWQACMRMAVYNPLFGVGPGESPFHMKEYGGIQGLMPHNTFLQVFAETGIAGGIFFLLFVIFPLIEAIIYFRKKELTGAPETRPLVLYKYLSISLAGFCVCSFFSNRVEAYILYVLIALIIAVKENLLNNNLIKA